jgi:ketosteroid isomerase-like protein
MRRARWSLLLLLMLSGPTYLSAQAAAAKKQIAALEDEWIKALVRRDAVAFDRLLAPDFFYTEDDHVVSRQQLIKDVTTGSDTVTGGRNEDLMVRVYGNAAVATGWLIVQGRGPSGPSEVRYRYTDTWVKLGGRWRVVAAHDYKKP